MLKKIFFLIIFLLIFAGGIGFYILSQPPKETLSKEFKEEAVTELLGRKAQLEVPSEKTGNALFEGEHVTFEYPAKAEEYTYRDPQSTGSSSAILEDFVFQIRVPRQRFSYSAALNSQSTTLDDIPAVRLRESRSYEYNKSTISVGSFRGVAFYKMGQEAEKSGFIVANSKIYTFVATGNSEKDVEKLFDDIIKSVKLK